jgi:hypothetical protein
MRPFLTRAIAPGFTDHTLPPGVGETDCICIFLASLHRAEILSGERDPSIDLRDAQEVVRHRTISVFLHQVRLPALEIAHFKARDFEYPRFFGHLCGDRRIKPLRGRHAVGSNFRRSSTGLNSGHRNWLGLRHQRRVCTENLQLTGAKVSTREFRGNEAK